MSRALRWGVGVAIAGALLSAAPAYADDATPTPLPSATIEVPLPTATPLPLPTTQPAPTTAPKTIVPPTRLAPKKVAPQSSQCDPSYVGKCLKDGIGDYDCAGGGGDGPNFVTGPVRVVGDDPFELDRDGNGVGCETSESSAPPATTPAPAPPKEPGATEPPLVPVANAADSLPNTGPGLPLVPVVLIGAVLVLAGTGVTVVARKR